MNTFRNFFFLICLIGWANFEPQQSQSDFIEFLGGYNGNNGLEPITPLGVIKEVYVSRNPGLRTSFICLSQNYSITPRCGLALTLLICIW